MKTTMRLVALSILALVGCDQPLTNSTTAPPPVNRFVPVANHGEADVALDTTTGQLCKTWNWVYRGQDIRQQGGIDTLPLCDDLYSNPATQHVTGQK